MDKSVDDRESTHVPVSSISFSTLWCQKWEDRESNRAPPTPDDPAFNAGFDEEEWDEIMITLDGQRVADRLCALFDGGRTVLLSYYFP